MNGNTKPLRSAALRLAAFWIVGATGSGLLAQPPGTQPVQHAVGGQLVVQSHRIDGAAAKGVAGKLKEMYAGRSDVQINDTPTGQLLVNAPHVVQQEIAHWLEKEGLTPREVRHAAAFEPAPVHNPQRLLTKSLQLKNLSARDFESRLISAWGPRLQSSQDSVGDVATFRFPPSPAGTTSIVVDRRTNTATVAAPETSASSWQRIVQMLDARPASADERTTVVPLGKADRSAVRKAATLLADLFAAAETRRKKHIGQFVSLLFAQEAGGAQPPPPPPPAGADTAQAIPAAGGPSAASLEQLARINNVQIEILDDVVVVRGRKEDVDRVLAIIAQIEQQSVQFRPELEVFHLKHVDSAAMAQMITDVYSAAFGRLGTVTTFPLQRPNALLLIGRKENIPAVVELIVKLDQPAPTDGEFRIFRLEHMSSIDAERTIRTFFTARPPQDTTLRTGLGTRAVVIADYRTNSLLVQAAPRDMLEIANLLQTLDVVDASATSEVRIFKLRNAIAATLAPILQEAITAAQASTTAQVQQGAAGQGTSARATPPALSLQFLHIGPEGQELIKSGIVANMSVSADAASNTLIVVGPASNMALMEALVERLDQLPASEAQIKVFTIRNGDATALAEMLQNLFGVPAAGAQGAVPGQGTATGAGDSAIVPLRFSVDQRTNSIIASGNAGDLNVIFHVLTRLDEGDIRQRQTAVYRLRNAPAQDVSNALTQLLQQQLQLLQIAPELVTPVESLDRQVIVVPEVVTNSLIVSATSRYFQEISKIIETLDRRPPMVVIQCVLAEVLLSDTEQFGVEWGLQDALMFDRSLNGATVPGRNVTGTPRDNNGRFNFNNPFLPNDPTDDSLATRNNVATQSLTNFALGRVDPALGFGGLVLTASSESVNVLLRALEQSSRAQIISRPQVQTLDNLPAFVQVGARVPRISGITATQTAVIPSVVDINVGLILQVTPRTSPDGTIVMQVYAEKSSVGPASTAVPVGTDTNGNPILSPQIPLTLAQTTVSARSGQTVILGGLITKDQQENTRRIPYLADIPVLGRLFRFDSLTNTRTELLIILTPYLVTSEEQIDWINARESERMSWCVADVVNIHGPVNLSGNPAFNAGPTPLIFPDVEPGAPPMLGPVPHSMGLESPYPTGPMPYQEGQPREPSGSTGPGTPTPATLPPGPGGYPSGPPPYQQQPPPQAPAEGAPPPPPPSGMGSARRTPDGGIIIPQPPSLIQPLGMRLPELPPQGQPVAPAEFQQPLR
jgi:general secretion pathway protein D